MTSPLSEDDDLIAAEYVLGVLDSAARAAAEASIRRDPDFAAAVQAWEHRLEGLNDDFAPASAPNLMPAIEAREAKALAWMDRQIERTKRRFRR